MTREHWPEQPALASGLRKDVIGYCDHISRLPGQLIGFKLSGLQPGRSKASVVELISGDDRPHGTGLIENPVAHLGELVDLPPQPIIPGSYAQIPNVPSVPSGRFSVWVWPTLLEDRTQTVAAVNGFKLNVDKQGVTLVTPNGELTLSATLQHERWYLLSVEFGESTILSVAKAAYGTHEEAWQREATGEFALACQAGAMWLAAAGPGEAHFNGRLEAPLLQKAKLQAGGSPGSVEMETVAAWDFSIDMHTQTIYDTGDLKLHGQLYQTPTRAVCGVQWQSGTESYLQDASKYGAIHFHDDDLTDAGWQDTLTWQIPDDLRSGQYALKIEFASNTGETSEEYLPFFVRAARPTARIVYLASTATYLAYANQRMGFTSSLVSKPVFRHANEAFLYAHPELGDSLYEYHRDGSGVHFSSRLRPVMNFKPRNTTWSFNGDTHITHWLHAQPEPFDVVTDEDLHLHGVEVLAGYQVVVTGAHPEYYSTQMRDALDAHLNDGGRLMYMGGNGFYWRVAFDPEQPGIMEVRRAEDGTRAWIARPAEYYHQFVPEYGGLWRRLGKPPNELVGVGFAAQGFDGGTYYEVQPGALDERVAFILDGIEAGETWGNFGNQGGGAAGEEIDRFDETLGSPPHAIVLASSKDHKPGMLRVKEEFHMMEPPVQNDKVRADIVFFETPSGGAVFSTGSISFAGSLAYDGFNNEIAGIANNVLQRFADPQAFEYPLDQPRK